MKLEIDDLRHILRTFADSDLQELRLEVAEVRLHVSKSAGEIPGLGGNPAVATVAETPMARRERSDGPDPGIATSAAATEQFTTGPAAPDGSRTTNGEESLFELRAPLLGVFYRRPSPDRDPFIEVGSDVEPDDPVCTIEVMKMFTQVEAGSRGRIREICVEDGVVVEYGQVLMLIEPR